MFKKLFLTKEIISKDGVLHFRRWRILSTKYLSIYIHEIFKADEDVHMHDHPWNYKSYVLSGIFLEESFDTSQKYSKFRVLEKHHSVERTASVFHTIKNIFTDKVVTLFVTGKKYKDWGYLVDGKWIQHEEYRKMKHQGLLNNKLVNGYQKIVHVAQSH